MIHILGKMGGGEGWGEGMALMESAEFFLWYIEWQKGRPTYC